MGNSTKAIVVWGIVVVAIMLISYLVIVKPILDDTDEQIDRAFDQSEQIQEEAFEDAEELQESIQENVGESIEESTGGTAAGSGGGGGGSSSGGANAQIEQANKLLSCISNAGGNISAIQACNAKYGP